MYIGAVIAIGVFIDKKINASHAKIQAKAETGDKLEILKNNSNIAIAANGKIYCKPIDGAKYGPMIGAFALPLLDLIKSPKLSYAIFNIALGALGGWVLGLLTDTWAAHEAKKQTEQR